MIGLEFLALLNFLTIVAGPTVLLTGMVFWFAKKKHDTTTKSILFFGILLTIAGWIYYRFFS